MQKINWEALLRSKPSEEINNSLPRELVRKPIAKNMVCIVVANIQKSLSYVTILSDLAGVCRLTEKEL